MKMNKTNDVLQNIEVIMVMEEDPSLSSLQQQIIDAEYLAEIEIREMLCN